MTFEMLTNYFFVDKENGRIKDSSISATDNFQQENCLIIYKELSNNVQSNLYNFKKKSGADCHSGNGGNYEGQGFICQKSLGNVVLICMKH